MMITEPPNPVISQHRLPHPYRAYFIVLWGLPLLLLVGVTIWGNGMSLALFDPRFLLLVGGMALPIWYFWQEGIDVHQRGIRCRVHIPQYYAYSDLSYWQIKNTSEGYVLQILSTENILVLSYHTTHLSEFPVLRGALENNLTSNTQLDS